MKRSKKKLATQAAIAIAMKKAGKRPKKYDDGGALDASQAQAYVNMLLNQAGTGEEKEDLMEGRHYIPRMPAETREKLIELGGDAIKKARMKSLEKRIGRKQEIIDEAARKEFDRDVDIDEKALDETDAMMDEEREVEEPTKNVGDVLQGLADKSEAELKYGGKLLKKYKKRKKRNRR